MKTLNLKQLNQAILITVLLMAVIAGIYSLQTQPSSPQTKTIISQASSNTTPTNSPLPPHSPLPPVSPTPIQPNPIPIGQPSQILIPSINLQASIIPIGITSDNYMETPHQAAEVGWYNLGAKPGQIGGAILNGHFDTPTGRPAIFYNLEKVQPNQQIIITTQDGQQLTYTIDQITSHPIDGFPTDLVYGKYTNQKLILITCNGVWDPIRQTYANRLVVTADIWKNT